MEGAHGWGCLADELYAQWSHDSLLGGAPWTSRRFGDWRLASAAYNAGGGKINRAIKKYGTRDFWEMSSDSYSYLKPETKNYVPKIIAAAILGANAS